MRIPKSPNIIRYRNLIIFLTFITASFVVYSCKKDLHSGSQPDTSTDPTVAQAKNWYESTYPANRNNITTQATTTSNGDLSQLIKPDWQHSSTYTRFNKNVIEIPIDPSSKFNSSLKNMFTAQSTNRAYSQSSFILLNNGTGYNAYIMTLIADSAYIKNDPDKLKNNKYNKRDPEYSGLLLYFTPKGKYIGGYRYLNGHIVSPSASNNNSGNKIQSVNNNKLKPMVSTTSECWDYYLVYYTNGREDSEQYLFTTCSGGADDGSGTGGSTGGGGGGGNGTSTSPTPTPVPPPCNGGSTLTESVHLVVNGNAPPGHDPTDPYNPTNPTGPDDPTDPDPGFPPPDDPGDGPCSVVATVTNNVKNSCLKNMVDQTIISGVNTQINSLIRNVFKGSTTINLDFTDVSTLPSIADGSTLPNNGIVNGSLDAHIQLNVNTLPNYSQEYIARVIMHEGLHAYMDSQGIAADEEHESMIINYVTQMTTSLRTMFPSLTEVDAQNLSLGGLQLTDTFQTKIKNDMQMSGDFAAINLAYSVGSRGTRCH